MTELPGWTYTGTIPLAQDLSVLEAALHSGRISAAERGYTAEPAEISTEEVMLISDEGDEPTYASAADLDAAGSEFAPTAVRFRMVWVAESS